MSERRELLGYATALGLLVAGGALCLILAGRPWGEAVVDDGLATTTEQATGRDLFPLAPAVAIVALAAVVAVPAVRRTGRRVVGVLLAAAGAVAAVGSSVVALGLPDRVTTWAERAGEPTAAAPAVTTAPASALLTGLGGLLIAAAGVAVALRGPRWPAMGRRYERDDGGTVAATEEPTGRAAWDALDRGEDPTA